MMNPTMYYQTKIMSDLFLDNADSSGVSFRTASQMDHFWRVSGQQSNEPSECHYKSVSVR